MSRCGTAVRQDGRVTRLLPADLLIHSAMLWTDGRMLDADTVVIAGGLVVAVGHRDELTANWHAERVIDAGGRLVTPAFADTHIHASWGGFEALRCDLTGCADAAACLQTIAAYAEAHPDLPWIQGGGWSQPFFDGGTPLRADLDRVVGDRPVFLFNRDHHSAWVSTAALRFAGLDATTPDPFDGRIEREPDGFPAGTLHEGAATLVGRVAPNITDADLRAGLQEAQRRLFGSGITAWHEAILGAYGGYPDAAEAYVAALAAGEVVGRVSGALWVPRGLTPTDAPRVAAELTARRDDLVARGLKVTAAKFMIDGVPETRTAAMREPYLGLGHDGEEGADTGIAHFDGATMAALVPLLNAAGIDMHAHAIGDRAVGYALDAVAAVPADVRAGRHNNIAHLQIVDPADVPRFGALGVIANAQPLWACNDAQMVHLCAPAIGPQRMEEQYPFASVLAGGGVLAFGSDWPITTPHPWETLEVAVTRRPPGDTSTEPLVPSEAISVHRALYAYTRAAHDLVGSPAGSLTVGAPADLAMADRNPLSAPRQLLHTTRTALTVLGGRIVHEED